MTRKEIIDGLKMTMGLITFDPSTGEDIDPDDLNDLNRTTYDACKGAVELLESQKTQLSKEDATFDTISRQAAIDAVESMLRRKFGIGGDLAEITLAGLPSAQPDAPDTNVGTMISRQAACEYCHEDSDGYVMPLEKNSHAFIRFGMDGWEIDLNARGWHGSAKVRFCPMCGRELGHG